MPIGNTTTRMVIFTAADKLLSRGRLVDLVGIRMLTGLADDVTRQFLNEWRAYSALSASEVSVSAQADVGSPLSEKGARACGAAVELANARNRLTANRQVMSLAHANLQADLDIAADAYQKASPRNYLRHAFGYRTNVEIRYHAYAGRLHDHP